MRVEISAPSPMDADGKVEDDKFVSTPIFYGKGDSKATVAMVRVLTDEGKEIFMGQLQVGGGSGEMSVLNRSNRVVANCDRKPAKKGDSLDVK